MNENNNITASDAADFDEVDAIMLPETMPKVTLVSSDEDDLFRDIDVEIETISE